MRFLMTVHADKNGNAGQPPPPKLMEAVAKLAEEKIKSGKMLITGGLAQHALATRIDVAGGKMTVTDGPFAETKELIAGFAIFELPSKADAVDEARAFFKMHQEILGPTWEGTMDNPRDLRLSHTRSALAGGEISALAHLSLYPRRKML